MENDNRNRGNTYNRFNEDWERERYGFNTAGRNRYIQEHGSSGQDGYNERYLNSGSSGYNDDRRSGSFYNAEGMQRPMAGTGFSAGSDLGDYGNDFNPGGYVRGGNQGSFGNTMGYNQQGNWQNRSGSYSNQGNRESDWARNPGAIGSAGMYGGDFGREEPERRDMGYGNDYRTGYSSNYGSQSNFGNFGNRSGMSGSYGSDWGRRNTGNSFSSGRGDQNRQYAGSGGDRDRGWWDRTKDEVSSWFGNDDDERNRRRGDQQSSSSNYKGRGPKGYQRSSERIREDVCDRLSDDEWLDASNIEVQVQGDEVILTGSVNSREDKRRAEDLVESIYGVRNVENRIRVGRGEDTFSSQTMNTGTASGSSTGGDRTSGTNTTLGSESSRKR